MEITGWALAILGGVESLALLPKLEKFLFKIVQDEVTGLIQEKLANILLESSPQLQELVSMVVPSQLPAPVSGISTAGRSAPDELNAGAISGITVGVFLAVALLVTAIAIRYCRGRVPLARKAVASASEAPVVASQDVVVSLESGVPPAPSPGMTGVGGVMDATVLADAPKGPLQDKNL